MNLKNIFSSLTKRPIPNTPYNNNYFGVGGLVPPARTGDGFLSAYGEIGWLHAVVFRIALGCSEVEWTLFDVSNQDKPKQIYKHPILNLLHQVNPFQTSNEFIALDTIYNELIGESFWALNFNALGEPAEIILPYPHRMSVVPAKEFPFVKGYVYGTGANAVPFDVNEIIHFKYPNPLNQYRGLAPARAIGINLDAEQNADKWVNQFFYNSARPDGVIQFDYNLSDEQFEKLKKQWSEKYKGVSKAHQVALLEGGGKYIQIQNTIKDMDFPNLKDRNRETILGVWGMPAGAMGISRDVNKANVEAADYQFARWLIKPRLDWKKAKIQEQLIPKFRHSENITIDFKEVVPKTIEQKIAAAESGMRAGYLTINEARKTQGLDSIPNGDVLLVPLNLIPTDIKKPMESSRYVDEDRNGQTDETEEETPKSKGLTPDQKRLRWEAYAKKTERQEEVFKKVFDSVFDEQKNQVIEMIENKDVRDTIRQLAKGGEGSGNFGHEGRLGEVGGSGEGGGSGETSPNSNGSGKGNDISIVDINNSPMYGGNLNNAIVATGSNEWDVVVDGERVLVGYRGREEDVPRKPIAKNKRASVIQKVWAIPVGGYYRISRSGNRYRTLDADIDDAIYDRPADTRNLGE